MNTNHHKSQAVVPCGPECEHASPLPAPYLDWVWCARPGAGEPARLDVTLCPHFRPLAKPGADRPAGLPEQS
jgi:hypothetical protein